MSEKNDKIYYPEQLPTVPLPETIDLPTRGSGGHSETKKLMSPTSTGVDVRFPPIQVARATISETLNTVTQKVLGSYTFGQVGSLAVGTYENGVSGDIRITPDGITARDINGSTTFSLDGTTGDAVFAGTITAGALVTGAVEVGDGSIVIDGANTRIVLYDASSNPFLVIGEV